jgi:excisionase family DNA binding protein
MDAPHESLWTAEDVAAYLKTSRSWVYSASAAGRLPCRRVGALLRFVPAEIHAWVDKTATAVSVRSLKR